MAVHIGHLFLLLFHDVQDRLKDGLEFTSLVGVGTVAEFLSDAKVRFQTYVVVPSFYDPHCKPYLFCYSLDRDRQGNR